LAGPFFDVSLVGLMKGSGQGERLGLHRSLCLGSRRHRADRRFLCRA
jgi:hypothetical protein